MLPDGFTWAPRWQHATRDDAVFLDGQVVAFIDQRVDGGWIAQLDTQRPIDAPLVSRRCSSHEQGRAGIEAWVCRHEDRLRREVAERIAARAASSRWAGRA